MLMYITPSTSRTAILPFPGISARPDMSIVISMAPLPKSASADSGTSIVRPSASIVIEPAMWADFASAAAVGAAATSSAVETFDTFDARSAVPLPHAPSATTNMIPAASERRTAAPGVGNGPVSTGTVTTLMPDANGPPRRAARSACWMVRRSWT